VLRATLVNTERLNHIDRTLARLEDSEDAFAGSAQLLVDKGLKIEKYGENRLNLWMNLRAARSVRPADI
jgi:hypothetical protein